MTPEVFSLDKLKVCRLSPLQCLCVADKDCNVTGSTDIFLADELSFLALSLYLQPTHPHYPGEVMSLGSLNHLSKPAT